MLETKGQSKQQVTVIVSYAILQVQQLYTIVEILLYG